MKNLQETLNKVGGFVDKNKSIITWIGVGVATLIGGALIGGLIIDEEEQENKLEEIIDVEVEEHK